MAAQTGLALMGWHGEDAGDQALWRRSLETESFLRPLALRRFKTALPLAVSIRERNPCLLRRLRLEGWNVRFMVMCGLRRDAKISHSG